MRNFKVFKNSFGFTIIELLVVISIMGVLASFAVYSTNKARMRARDARRMMDVKQIETALRLYYQDHNSFPPNTDNDASGWDCGSADYDTKFIQPLADGNYINPVPTEIKKGTGCYYRYYNYGDRTIFAIRLEMPQTVPDRCNVQSWIDDNRFYCIDFVKDK